MSERFLLAESARRFGHYLWAERRLFEVLGGWAGDTEDPATRPVFASHAAHHAWRAGLWRDRLPRARGLDVDALAGPANAELVALFDEVATPGPADTVGRLVGVYRVIVPHLGRAYLYHLDRLVPISDGPTMRYLRLVLLDLLADWKVGVGLLDARLASGAADRAAAREAWLTELLAAAGGAAGPGTVGPDAVDFPPGPSGRGLRTVPRSTDPGERKSGVTPPPTPDVPEAAERSGRSGSGSPDADALLQRVARGEESAFSALYDMVVSRVYGLVLRVVRDAAQAEEVSQEALVDVWRRASS